MAVWSSKSRLVQFTKQDAINGDIEGGIKAIADCMVDLNVRCNFLCTAVLNLNTSIGIQLASQISIHEWQTQFAENVKQDHADVTQYLSEMRNLQDIIRGTLAEQGNILREIMATMQNVCGLPFVELPSKIPLPK